LAFRDPYELPGSGKVGTRRIKKNKILRIPTFPGPGSSYRSLKAKEIFRIRLSSPVFSYSSTLEVHVHRLTSLKLPFTLSIIYIRTYSTYLLIRTYSTYLLIRSYSTYLLIRTSSTYLLIHSKPLIVTFPLFLMIFDLFNYIV
jgi:hypothetical protein